MEPNDGTYVNGHWDDSPIGGGAKVLALQGDGYVDCSNLVFLSPITVALVLVVGLALSTLMV